MCIFHTWSMWAWYSLFSEKPHSHCQKTHWTKPVVAKEQEDNLNVGAQGALQFLFPLLVQVGPFFGWNPKPGGVQVEIQLWLVELMCVFPV